MSYDALTNLLDARLEGRSPVHAVVPYLASSPPLLAGLHRAASGASLRVTIMAGGAEAVTDAVRLEDEEGITLQRAPSDEDALKRTTELLREDPEAVLLLPPAQARGMLERLRKLDGGLFDPPGRSAAFTLFHPKKLERPLLVGDVFVHAEPDEETLVHVVRLGCQLAGTLGIEHPRAALLAAVEVANPGLPVTMTMQEVARRLEDDEGSSVEGPLSMDLAISPHAAEKKGATGPVAGRADLLVAGNLTVARGVMQAINLLAGEAEGTVLLGNRMPVALPNRGDLERSTILSLTLGAVIAASR